MNKPSLAAIKAKIGGKGLYITAAACMIAVGGVGAAAYNKAVKQINDGLNYTAPSITEPEKGIQADDKKDDIPLPAESEEESEAELPAEDETSKDEPIITQPNVMPVNGEIIEPFSFGELVKSKTLNVWKTHDGVDIKAEPGDSVKSMNRGNVTEVWDDPLWGYCVTIDHGNGIVGYYYSLSASVLVEEGDEVQSGQIIATVGDTAQIEAAEPSHLHFGLKRNGQWIDPISYIEPFGSK